MDLICKRDNSQIFKYTDPVFGDCIYKEVYGQPQLTTEGVMSSYLLYEKLVDKKGLVQVHKFWETANTVHVVMENLEGWRRIGKDHYSQAFKIIVNLAEQGVIDWDYSVTNFLVSPEGEVKMVDLDRLIKMSNLPECPPKEHWILTWFGSKVVKFLKEM